MTSSISIKHVGKCYKMYPSRNSRLKEWILPFGESRHVDKWVLKDINLEVASGEAVGIIGMNGAGKSTLLKIITGTTVTTTGKVSFDGTVAALLELGLGFHPDFTGRQNVYMSGQLLGYTNEEITECMQQVEDFAEIGDAIDAPVRTYSSGMQVRLAFSVATMKRPDILIVDEALSVGDVYFQHKSFSRIKEFRDRGTTLLLVSHDKGAIQAVCNRAVLLDHGNLMKIGKPEEIMDYYNAMLAKNENNNIHQVELNDGRVKTISGNGFVKMRSIQLLDSKGLFSEIVDVGEFVRIRVSVEAKKKVDDVVCGFQIKDRLGQVVYGINTASEEKGKKSLEVGEVCIYEFSFYMNIGEGNYSITIALHSATTHIENNYEWTDLALVFQVVNQTKGHFAGNTWLNADFNISNDVKLS